MLVAVARNVTSAWPALSVVALLDDTAPLPDTAYVTVAPATALPNASATKTASGCEVTPAASVCGSPDSMVSAPGAAAVAVAVNTIWPVTPAAETSTVLAPAVVPSVSVADACPCESVLTCAADRLPPPVATPNETSTPGTGRDCASVTVTTNGDASDAATVPLC